MSNQTIEIPELPSNIKVKIARTEEEVEAFSRIAAKVFCLLEHTAQQFAKVNLATMNAKEQIH